MQTAEFVLQLCLMLEASPASWTKYFINQNRKSKTSDALKLRVCQCNVVRFWGYVCLCYNAWIWKLFFFKSHKNKVKATKIRFLKLTTWHTLNIWESNFFSKFYIMKIICLYLFLIFLFLLAHFFCVIYSFLCFFLRPSFSMSSFVLFSFLPNKWG